MSRSRRGFILYITFVVTSVLLLLVLGGQEIVRFSLDMGRSAALETVAFHAADGGLERGLARFATHAAAFRFAYESRLDAHRTVTVEVEARRTANNTYMLSSAAGVRDGGREVARRRLVRRDVSRTGGNLVRGRFEEAS
ncbi:MAG TPA: hypothetical protein PLP29_16865 [Candidatus Ozemobacteraceae bacterium]|nr:hypothetical protein [Candidatus Ozemobacteraceae bacterium]